MLVKLHINILLILLNFVNHNYYYENKDKSLMVSTEYILKNIRDFGQFTEEFAKCVNELHKNGMKCIKQCVDAKFGCDS